LNERTASELAGYWLAAHNQPNGGPLELRSVLAEELQTGFPDPELHGVAEFTGVPCLLAVSGEGLLIATAAFDPEQLAVVDLQVLPLLPRPAIRVTSTTSADGTLRRRTWRLQPTIGEPVTLSTTEIVRVPFAADVRPDSGELLMRAILFRV
jgi:hypothetical protein